MDAKNLPKGQSREVSSSGSSKPGIYKHKETGATFITAEGDDGITQADALLTPIWNNQWEWIGEPPSRSELLAMQKAQAEKEAKTETNSKVKAELEALAKS